MAVIQSGSFAKALWPGINAWYGKAYDEHRVEYSELFDKFTSTKQYEEDVGISSFGMAPIKPEGSSIAYDEEKQGFVTRYTHVEYALGFIITEIMMEDDQYDVVGQRRARGLDRHRARQGCVVLSRARRAACRAGAERGRQRCRRMGGRRLRPAAQPDARLQQPLGGGRRACVPGAHACALRAHVVTRATHIRGADMPMQIP